MKKRNGFVSNSSSSSFIIQIKDDGFIRDEEFLADEDKISLLEEYGFEHTSIREVMSCKRFYPEDPDRQHFMYYNVTCNEEEVLVFLMENNIPFRSSCSYDNYVVMMAKNEDLYLYANNFGIEVSMYGFKNKSYWWEQLTRKPKVERRSVKQFIKENSCED